MAQHRAELNSFRPGSKEEESSNEQRVLTRLIPAWIASAGAGHIHPGRGLFVAIGNAAFGQIVGRHFHGDTVTGQYTDSIPAELSGEMGEHEPFLIQLHTEQATGELLDHSSGNFNTILFTHWPPGRFCLRDTFFLFYKYSGNDARRLKGTNEKRKLRR